MHKPKIKDLKHQIIFIQNNAVDEAQLDNWQYVTSAYASIAPMYDTKFSQLECFQFDHIMTEELFIFKMRFIQNLNNNMRIKFGNRLFDIKRIINLQEENKWLHIISLEIL